MSEKIYDLLNEVEMDLDKYQKMDLSDVEMKRIKNNVLQEVRTMNQIKKDKRKFTKKTAGLVAAAGLAICVTAVGSNVSAAKMLLSTTFQKIISGTTGEKDAEETKQLYTKIGKESVPVEKEKGDILESQDAGVTLRVSDIYCDGYILYYTMELETARKELTAKKVDGIASDDSTQSLLTCIDGEENANYAGFKRQADGTYTSVMKEILYTANTPKTYQNGDKIPVDIKLNSIVGWDLDNHDKSGEYVHTKAVKGDWKLSFSATVDTSKNVTKEINKEDNGVKLLSATRTKGAIHLVIQEPNYSAKPYNDKYNDPDRMVADKNDNALQWLGGYDDIQDDGSHIQYITLLDDGGEAYYLEVTNKNRDGEQIAKIKFHLGQ